MGLCNCEFIYKGNKMSTQNNKTSQFVRVYRRSSRSPWDDASTILIFADVQKFGKDETALGFDNYIYLHRSVAGEVLGLSMSKAMLENNPEFSGRYLAGEEMMRFIECYINEISIFCEFFEAEFTSLFLLPPRAFFHALSDYWSTQQA